jgi:hypothetical protein
MTLRRWLILIALVLVAWLASRCREDRARKAPGPAPDPEPTVESPPSPAGSGVTEAKPPEEKAPARDPIVDDGILDLLAHENVDPGSSPDSSRPNAVLVVDDRGRPVAGASVYSRRGSAVTDQRGIAWIPTIMGGHNMPSQDRYWRTITASAPGFAPVNTKGHNSKPHEVVRLANRGSVLAGTCVDEEGRPVAGVALKTSGDWWNPGVTIVTDETGRFETDRAPRRRMMLHVSSSHYRSDAVEVVPPQTGIAMTVTKRERPVRPGSRPDSPKRRAPEVAKAGPEFVVDAIGTEGLNSLWAGFGNGEVLCLVKKFKTDGKPVNLRLPREDLRWLAIGWYPAATLRDVPIGTRRVSLSLKKTACVHGGLVNRRGRAIPGGWIALRWPGSRETARSIPVGIPFGLPGADRPEGASFTIDGVGPGRYDVVWNTRFLRESVVLKRNVVMPEEPVNVDLGTLVVRPTATAFRVLVTDERGAPVEGAVVEIGSDTPPAAARTDRDGIATFSLYDLTGFGIEVSAKGYATKRTRTSTDDIPSLIEVRLSAD